MLLMHHGQHLGKASVTFLPMIDLQLSRIYFTLKFVPTQVLMNDVTPVLTFKQPLNRKALLIKHISQMMDLKRIVLRLGGSRMLMSFLDSIGHLIASFGLPRVARGSVHWQHSKLHDHCLQRSARQHADRCGSKHYSGSRYIQCANTKLSYQQTLLQVTWQLV